MFVYYVEGTNEIAMLSEKEQVDRISELYLGKTLISFNSEKTLDDIHKPNVTSFYVDIIEGVPKLITVDGPEAQPEQTETEILGQQLVEKDLQILGLQQENQVLGQQLVDIDLRLLMGGM